MSISHSPTALSKIFISYRRSESAVHAGRLSDQLTSHFGSQIIFIDFESIEPGRDFVEAIEGAVGSCKILLAVIGQQWLTCANEHGRRIDDPNDFVQLEIAAALTRGIRVIPILVQGATMPREQDLPVKLAPLARKQAWQVRDSSWKEDVRKLITKIESDIESSSPTRSSLRQRMVGWYRGLRLKYKTIALLIAIIGLVAGVSGPINNYLFGREIILGYVNHSSDGNADTLRAKYQKYVADVATGKLIDTSIKYQFRAKVPRGNYDQLLPAIMKNEVDIGFMAPFQYLVEKKRDEKILKRLKGVKVFAKATKYHTVFLVHKRSGMSESSDIKPDKVDRILLGNDANSTSTNVIPRIFIWWKGLKDKVITNDKTRLEIIKEVASGKDVKLIGAISSTDWDDLIQHKDFQSVYQDAINNLQPITISEIPIPYDAVLINESTIREKVNNDKDEGAIYEALGDNLDRLENWDIRNKVFKDFVLSGTVISKDGNLYQVMLPPVDHDLEEISNKISNGPRQACLVEYSLPEGHPGGYPMQKNEVGKGILRKKNSGIANEAEFELQIYEDKNNKLLDPTNNLLQVEICSY